MEVVIHIAFKELTDKDHVTIIRHEIWQPLPVFRVAHHQIETLWQNSVVSKLCMSILLYTRLIVRRVP